MIITCSKCGKTIDTDYNVDFICVDNKFICEDCVEEVKNERDTTI